MSETATARPRSLAPLGVLKASALLLVGYKLLLFFFGGVFQDEAYYWLWGQHFALSYFDHPPLNAWLQGLAGSLLGWNRFSLRIVVALVLVVDVLVLRLISKRLAPDWPEHFWITLILFLGTPIFFLVTAVALPDHLLVLGILGALYFFLGFFRRWQNEPGASYRDLYLGALCLGFAALAKYNAAFFALGLGLYILLIPRLRPLLGKPQLYLAALLALVIQTPVVLWNLSENLASFGFILGSRHAGLPTFSGVGIWVVSLILFVGPVLLVPMFAFALSWRREGGLARLAFWISTLVIFGISLGTSTLFHWNLVAYLAALPFLAWYFRPRLLFWGHLLYCVAFLSFVTVNFSFLPLTDIEGWRDEATAWAYGWEEAAAAVTEEKAKSGASFVATPDYTTASLLAFAMGDKDVTSLNPKRDQFDYWFDSVAHTGQDAILFGDRWRPLPAEVTDRFESVTPLRTLTVERGGKLLDTQTIFLGKGFKP
jgi:4-amino-4-deoxy-L-arabinose transferase-like glycosyltransferase